MRRNNFFRRTKGNISSLTARIPFLIIRETLKIQLICLVAILDRVCSLLVRVCSRCVGKELVCQCSLIALFIASQVLPMVNDILH